jgi:cleavage and polyadenylation specificity factor subunit 1
VRLLGLQLFIKALDLDERLLSVGFLDIGAHTTSIRTIKNFILLGDALRGITFIAFQETPYKVLPLGKDPRSRPTNTADFIVYEGKLAFMTTDKAGIVRIFEYNPTNLESRGGERLLGRTEYQGAAEVSATLLYSRKTGTEEEARQSGLLQGAQALYCRAG